MELRLSSLITCITLSAALIILPGCDKNSPKEVAKSWLVSFYKMDFDAAKKLSTEDAKNMLSTFQVLGSDVTDSFKRNMKKIDITIKKVKIIGDTAAIATYTMSDIPDKEEYLNLVKQNDKWLVQYSKDDTRSSLIDTTTIQQTAPDTSMSSGSAIDSADASKK